MFPNLKAEMARNGQKNCDVAEKLGISRICRKDANGKLQALRGESPV